MPSWTEIFPGVWEGKPGQEKSELENLVKLSNIPPQTLKTHRLSTWKHKEGEVWWKLVEDYANGNYGHSFLSFLGTVGTGKTHLALSIGWEWLARGKLALYYQVENLLDTLRRGYSTWQRGDPDGYQSILAFTQNVSLLILDDLGAQQETEWSASKLDQIVDSRYLNQKPLIVTSNLTLNLLPARISDRLSEGKIIQLKGASFRKTGKGGSLIFPRL